MDEELDLPLGRGHRGGGIKVLQMGITKPCKDGVEIVGPLLQPESLTICKQEEPLMGAHGGLLSVQVGVWCVRLGQSFTSHRNSRIRVLNLLQGSGEA